MNKVLISADKPQQQFDVSPFCQTFSVSWRQREGCKVSGDTEPTVQPKAQAAREFCQHHHDVQKKRLQSPSVCQICRETAFLNNKQRGVLQLKQGENELVINDERFHPRLHIKKRKRSLKSDTFVTSSGYFFFLLKSSFIYLSLPAKAELSQTEKEEPLKWITRTRARQSFQIFWFCSKKLYFLIHPRWSVVFVKPVSWVNWGLKRCLLTWRYDLLAAVQSCWRTIPHFPTFVNDTQRQPPPSRAIGRTVKKQTQVLPVYLCLYIYFSSKCVSLALFSPPPRPLTTLRVQHPFWYCYWYWFFYCRVALVRAPFCLGLLIEAA